MLILTRMMDVNLIIIFIAGAIAWAGFIFGMFTFNLYQTHSQTIFAIDNIMWCGGCSWYWRHDFDCRLLFIFIYNQSTMSGDRCYCFICFVVFFLVNFWLCLFIYCLTLFWLGMFYFKLNSLDNRVIKSVED